MSTSLSPQTAILAPGTAHGISLEWSLTGTPALALEALRNLDSSLAVIGLGAPLVATLGGEVSGLRSFPRMVARAVMPSTQAALWAFVAADDPSDVFDRSELLQARVGSHFTLNEATSLFRYRDTRDLAGFRDGIANPHGEAAVEAAIIAEGPVAGGSFALVQRFVYFRDRLLGLSQEERNRVIGRDAQSDAELEDAPQSAHVKRVDQEQFKPQGFMLRRSMPWGNARRQGLQFIAFMADLDLADRMLRRMNGDADGVQDAVLGHVQAETGAYYFCPRLAEGKLDLSFINPSAAAAGQQAESIETVEGKGVSIVFDAAKCIHSRGCVLARPDVFVPNVQGAWLHPERATPDEIAELARNCPSGAIRYRRDDGADERAPMVNTVRIRENGPLAVHADLRIAGREPSLRATLCRCGASRNKPFCDGSHAAVGFQATGEPVARPGADLAERSNALIVRPIADGPLAVDGPLEIVSGTGHTLLKTTQAALCRCGHSQNKPYCDGSHARAGFRAD
jgi:Dyp-type peroxidase family